MTMFTRLSLLSKNLVWGFLGAHAHKPQVYARKIEDFVPFIADKQAYLFATEEEAIIVCIDIMPPHTDELADEEPFGSREPMYFTEKSHRISPVYRLSQAMSMLSQSFDYYDVKAPAIRGVLLTTSHFINEDQMRDHWDQMGIAVFESMPECVRHSFTVETRDDLPMAKWYQLFYDYAQRLPFPDMIHDFRHMNDDDDDFDNADGDNDDDDDDWLMSDDDDDTPDDFTNALGEFMMSKNNKVKVEILKPISQPLQELDRLVGCADIRKQIDALLALNRYNQLMRCLNPRGKQHELALHAIFFGRPGTGKTTVCKIYGSLLYEAGMLSQGHVVCCNRSTFIGSNWGDEDTAVRNVVEMARGGVLMIDEAYLLNSNHPNDPGKLVIPLLMDILANEDMRDIAIVLCGYKDEMLRLIDLNPGLDSRFPNRFEFPDFTIADLLEITRRRIRDYGYHFTRSAWNKYKDAISAAYESRDAKTWGNARFVTNQLEHIYLCHARRCIRLKNPNRQRVLSITTADIQPIALSKPKKRVGF